MRRINTSTKATDLHGAGKHGFKAGNALTGELPTQFSALWADDVQEEISNAIEGASIVLGASQSQLLAAIIALAAQQAQLAANPTGIVDHIFGSTAPTGWVRRLGGTIGNAASGATERANADTLALFTKIWNESANAGDYVIQESTGAASVRGASAAADFAANKRMPLPNDPDFDRGIPAGAVLGTHYDDTIKSHEHSLQLVGTTMGGVGIESVDRRDTNGNGAGTMTASNKALAQAGGALETAPKHRCYLPIIKL